MSNSLTAIIGDSSPATSAKLAEAFQTEGVQLLATCSDGLALVQACLQHRPAIVSLDLVLPKLTGLQVIQALRRKGLDPVFVVTSAVSARNRVIEAKEAGVAFYILKPLDDARLAQIAARLAGRLEAETA